MASTFGIEAAVKVIINVSENVRSNYLFKLNYLLFLF
jgi:hypothetical protein